MSALDKLELELFQDGDGVFSSVESSGEDYLGEGEGANAAATDSTRTEEGEAADASSSNGRNATSLALSSILPDFKVASLEVTGASSTSGSPVAFALAPLVQQPILINPIDVSGGFSLDTGFESPFAAQSFSSSLYGSYGSSSEVESGTGNATAAVVASGNAIIDGILTNTRWASSSIDYSFPTSGTPYSYTTNSAFVTNMSALTAQQQTAAHFALNTAYSGAAAAGFSVEGFTGLGVFYDSTADTDEIRLANTSSGLVSTARVADFPSNDITTQIDDNGDVWFGGSGTTPTAGNYHWHTVIHEIGHALGLSHGHSTYQLGVALPAAYDSMEFSIMTYRSYIGGPTTGYTNETWGYAQTFMMADIAALQYLYGADFSTNNTNTVYKWNPTSGDTLVNGAVGIDAGGNRIFATIWDGGGIDTYDLSSYSTNLQIDLNPGGHSLFSTTQQANLGAGNFARGNIFNAFQYNGDARSLIENATGGSGADSIVGNTANNNLIGNAGNDTLIGNSGNDTLVGGSGTDSLVGGTGNDVFQFFPGNHQNETINGGSGTDKILLSGIGTFNFNGSGLSISSIEEIEFHADVGGTKTANFTIKEFDHVSEVPANLHIDSSGGNVDILNFTVVGSVFSTINWSGWTFQDWDDHLDQINITLGGGITSFTATQQRDNIQGTSDAEFIDGQGDNDSILGGSGVDTLLGGAGNDTLNGGAHEDSLNGGSGNDLFLFTGGDFIDNVDGGTGTDTIDFSGYTFNFLTANLGAGTMTVGGGAGVTTLLNVENVIGTANNDVITGSGAANSLSGGGGNDSILGGGGVDTLLGGSGNDTLRGGSGDDSILGGGGVDTLLGGSGNDTLRGGSGDDSINGGIGDDLIVVTGGDGLDNVDGGSGNDTLDYSGTGGAIVTNLLTNSFTYNGFSRTMVGIENFISGIGNDVLAGNPGGNLLNGGGGNDIIRGGGGNDTLLGGTGHDRLFAIGAALGGGVNADYLDGGSGNDTLYGSDGNDTLLGGGGNDYLRGNGGNDVINGHAGADRVDYFYANGAVNVNLATGLATGAEGNDTLISIEHIHGSNGFGDVLAGNAAHNDIRGHGGNDTIRGGGGNDTLLGGAGSDLMFGVGNPLGVAVNADYMDGGSGNDTLYGSDGNDTLLGGGGNDYLRGNGGNDVINGHAGIDRVDYTFASGPVNVNLSTGLATGAEGNDTLTGIEHINGSNGFDDVLIGNAAANHINGLSGNDTIRGGGGNDTLLGGAGDDRLIGDSGADLFVFHNGFGQDTVVGFSSNNGEDINLSAVTNITSFADLTSNHLVSAGGFAMIVDGANSILLDGVAFSDVGVGQLYSAHDFIF